MQSTYLNDSFKCKYKYTNRVSTASFLSQTFLKGCITTEAYSPAWFQWKPISDLKDLSLQKIFKEYIFLLLITFNPSNSLGSKSNYDNDYDNNK